MSATEQLVARPAIHLVIVRTPTGCFRFAILRDASCALRLARRLISLGIAVEVDALSEKETLEFEANMIERGSDSCGGVLFGLIEAAGLRTTSHPFWDGIRSGVH